jgi:hypothetical protein
MLLMIIVTIIVMMVKIVCRATEEYFLTHFAKNVALKARIILFPAGPLQHRCARRLGEAVIPAIDDPHVLDPSILRLKPVTVPLQPFSELSGNSARDKEAEVNDADHADLVASQCGGKPARPSSAEHDNSPTPF